jgi:hypothetical protein
MFSSSFEKDASEGELRKDVVLKGNSCSVWVGAAPVVGRGRCDGSCPTMVAGERSGPLASGEAGGPGRQLGGMGKGNVNILRRGRKGRELNSLGSWKLSLVEKQ